MSLYGLIVGIAIVVGLQYFDKHNTVVPPKLVNWFIIGLLLSLLVGARAYHVASSWDYYSQHFWQIFNTRGGGLGIYGALMAGTIFIFIFSLFFRLPLVTLFDSLTPIIPLCQSIGRFGNFVNREIPIWWLESLLCFCLYLFIKKFPRNPTAKYLIGYGLIRLLTEIPRTDTWALGSLKIAQLISLIFVILGIFLLKYQSRLHRLVA